MQFGIEFEKQLLATLISQQKYFNAGKFIESNHFSLPQHQFIFALYEYYNKNANSGINDYILKEECKSQKIPDEATLMIIKEHEQLKDLCVQVQGSEKAIIYKARQFVNNKLVKDSADKIKQLTDEGKYEEAFKIYKKVNDASNKFTSDVDSYEIIDWFDSFRDRMKSQKLLVESGVVPIKTGFTDLDKLMLGGYTEGDMFGIMAATNVGKSALITHLCGYNADQGVGGILFLTEMHAHRMAMRLDARNTYVDFKRFKNYQFSAKEEETLIKYYESYANHYRDLLKLVSVKKNSASGTKVHGISFDFMREAVEEHRSKIRNFRYIAIDCGNHIIMGTKEYKTEKEKQAAFAWSIDVFLEQENVAGLITFQTNRQGAKGTENETIGSAYEIAQCSDWLLGINICEKSSLPREKHEIPNEEFYEGGIDQVVENLDDESGTKSFELNLSKAREGEKGTVKVNAMMNRMFYFDQQALLSERVSIV